MKIELEIKSISNGWIVNDNYYGGGTFFEEYKEAATHAKKLLTKFGRDEAQYV